MQRKGQVDTCHTCGSTCLRAEFCGTPARGRPRRRARGVASIGGEGDLKMAPGGARARRTTRPRGARGSSLLSSNISPVWPVNYVCARSPSERLRRRARGGRLMGGEGDLKAAPGGARARRTARPRSARGFYLLSSHISPVWPVNYVWRAVAQRAAQWARGRALPSGPSPRPPAGLGLGRTKHT
jgi:hypothetical protein